MVAPMDKADIDPSDDPIYRAGVLMGRNQALTDVMERLFSPDAMSAEKNRPSPPRLDATDHGRGSDRDAARVR